MNGFLAGTLDAHRDREERGFVVPHLVDGLNTCDIHLSSAVKHRIVVYYSAGFVAKVVTRKSKVEVRIRWFV